MLIDNQIWFYDIFRVIPIIFHAILFEPVLQKKDSVEKQVNPEELDIENN